MRSTRCSARPTGRSSSPRSSNPRANALSLSPRGLWRKFVRWPGSTRRADGGVALRGNEFEVVSLRLVGGRAVVVPPDHGDGHTDRTTALQLALPPEDREPDKVAGVRVDANEVPLHRC